MIGILRFIVVLSVTSHAFQRKIELIFDVTIDTGYNLVRPLQRETAGGQVIELGAGP